MIITINHQDNRLVAALSGDFDYTASTQAERSLAPVFGITDKDIVIDSTELNYISSSGLRILLSIFKHTRSYGHVSILKGMTPEVKEVFELSGFLQLFKIEN